MYVLCCETSAIYSTIASVIIYGIAAKNSLSLSASFLSHNLSFYKKCKLLYLVNFHKIDNSLTVTILTDFPWF